MDGSIPAVENNDINKLMFNKVNIENITPHKIAVVAFIREYGLLKIEATKAIECPPKYRKDFCILALKLIQCPDMEFKELEALLTDGRYNLLNVHLQNFCVRLENIIRNGISALMDCVTSTIDKLMIETNETSPCIITRCSVLGFYLRRIMLQLDKLTFVQLVSLYKAFCLYYQKGRPGLIVRSMSKEKLDLMESQSQGPPVDAEELKKPNQEPCTRVNIVEKDNNFEECQWSRKQAELFTSQQANLLEINEKKALPPRQLQKNIMKIIKDIPDYSDVHFLSFLNCIRIREFCGAQDSLYNCFDRTLFNTTNNTPGNDRNKSFRYAALNRAAMHIQFGHKSVAMESVREAVVCAQEAGDAGCVAHAATWGALAGGRGRRAALLARVPHVPRAAAAAALLLAQHAAVNAHKPADVFQMITKGDTINYLHSLTDLTLSGLANTAALWSMYGKTEMASITCQLLLNLNSKCWSGVGGSGGGVWHLSAGARTGAAGAASAAAWRGGGGGGGALAAALLSAPHLAHYHSHKHRLRATTALQAGKLEEADQSIRRLAAFDRWESQLLKAELYSMKGNATDAIECLKDILDYCKTEDDSLHFMSLRLKAMILMSQVQFSYSSTQSTNIMLLNEALSLAKKYHLLYLAATIEMHIANVQLHMGCAKNALILVRKVLPSIMAHGSAYDMGRGLLLYTKCRIATASASGDSRTQTLQSCCEALEIVKTQFSKVGAQVQLLQTWYLQAQLFNEIGNLAARNQCAWMYRQLETQNPLEMSNVSLLMY